MRKLPPWCVGTATFLLLLTVCLWDYYPPLGPQHLTVAFPKTYPGEADPIVVTGKPRAADYIAVRYLDARTVTFVYDHWGRGGPTSPPFTIEPGRRYPLELDLPSFATLPNNPDAPPGRVRVIFDGRVALDAILPFHQRGAQHAFFGQNPAGGTLCGGTFRGELLTADGRPWVGSVRTLISRADRFTGWLWSGRWQLVVIAVLSICAGWTWKKLTLAHLASALSLPARARAALQSHRAFTLTTALCALAYTALLTNGRFQLIHEESFGNFYDYQARSLLQGRLDVPEPCIGGEAFVHGGKIYGYFGPTPALLRLPLVIFGVAFGHLSRVAMLVYFVATLLGAYLLLRYTLRVFRSSQPTPAAWETVLFTAHVGLGTTAFFLGSRAYIYHEAILCGILFAVWSCWCSLRLLEKPDSRWWLGALLLGTLSVHARPPAGLFALTVLGCAAVAIMRPHLRPFSVSALRRPVLIGALSVAGVASFNALSYAKFHTIEGCPLRLNVQYTAKRLAHIDGKQFHLSNLRYGLDTYLLRPRVELSPNFPWLYQARRLDPNTYPGAKIDLPDRTLALPIGMAGLFLLATAGCAWLAWRDPAARPLVAVLWLSFVPLTLAMCAAIATAERYTGDFVPFVICAGAVGFAGLHRRPVFTALFVAATLWSCALHVAVGFHYQGKLVWGVEDGVPERYQKLRTHIDTFFHVSSPSRP